MYKLKLFPVFMLLGVGLSVAMVQEPPPILSDPNGLFSHAYPPEPDLWVTTTAYTVQWAFNDPPWEPHYGAFFNGSSCHNQHYLGPGGDEATCSQGCIQNWNWWGGDRNVLLLPKCWLYAWLCILNPISERWQGSSYQASCWIN